MRKARGQKMEPATQECHPVPRNAGGKAPSRDTSEKTKNDEKTTRRGKLKVKIHVGDLRNTLSEMEQKLSGLKRKYERLNKIGEQRCLKRSPKSILKNDQIKGDIHSLDVSDVDEKDIVPEKDVGFMPLKPLSKLPVLDKHKFDEKPRLTTDILTKVVGLETLYGVLMEEHLGLQLALQDTSRRLRAEERRARELEERRNPINLALAERIGLLQAEVDTLRRTVADLREENDHLEFRLLEMDEPPIKKTVYRSAESTRYDPATDIDDVSDSGVMSLPASDDEHNDFSMVEAKGESDVKGRLLSLSQNSAVGDRICIQQGLALLRHYESRIESLEATIAAMCHEATMSRSLQGSDDLRVGDRSRIIATVLPFTERKESGLQESGIFEGDSEVGSCCPSPAELTSRGTQTEDEPMLAKSVPSPVVGSAADGDLSTELEKLSRIRQKIEKTSLPAVQEQMPPCKQLAYYRARVETLESRLELYQARPDEASRLLKARVEKEARLEAEIARLREKVAKLEEENRLLEEERCELEEAENDTRLRCQKLEFKLSALGEKKNCLKAQLEQLTHEMATSEEERKQATRMEAIIQNYEKKNQELEEREMELRYRLQMTESSMPALMMWNMMRMMVTMQGQNPAMQGMLPPTSTPAIQTPSGRTVSPKEEELVARLQALEARLNAENRMLQESRNAEETLRSKIRDLEQILDSKDTNILQILDRDPTQDIQAFEKLSKMAKERVELDRRIKDLELKEKMYQETLQQVDVMFSDMEGNYTKQLQEKDDQLYDKENKLAETEFKLRQSAQVSEMNMQLQERLATLEMEMKKMTETLMKREKEREQLELEEKRLQAELQESLQELDSLKKHIEGPMKGQLEVQRKKAANLEERLDKEQTERLNMEAEHQNEVNALEKRIEKLNKELMENDVTIGELREEVQTLENAISDLKYQLSMQSMEKEDLKRYFEAKIEEKERLFEELKESLKSKKPERSLKDEMEESMRQQCNPGVDMNSMMGGDCIADAENIEVNCRLSGPFQEPSETSSNKSQPGSLLPTIIDEKQLNELKSKTSCVLEDLIKEIDRGEPLLDTESNKGIPNDNYQQCHSLPPECQSAQKAVSSFSECDVSATLDNFSGAFQHSKVCKICNETLGSFLGDLIKELRMRSPSTNVLGNRQL